MINNFFKIINNKYSRYFRFIFFLRYLFGIFIIAIITFLTIPSFFNYEKRAEIIKNNVFKKYNLKIRDYEKIEFSALPYPRLNIKNVQLEFESNKINWKIKNLLIYPKIFEIYKYENFKIKKIILDQNIIGLEVSNFKFFIDYFAAQKKKLLLKNSTLIINDKSNLILNLKNAEFSNFGYNKNIISGEIFDKKFKIKVNDDLDNLDFKLINSGISAEIDFKANNLNDSLAGIFKSKILNTNIKFEFDYNNKILRIYNSFLRNKNLSFKNNSEITLKPYLESNSTFEIENLDYKIIEKVNLNNFLKSKNIIKKISSKNQINYKSKKLGKTLIDELRLNIIFAYGNARFTKETFLLDGTLICDGDINLLEDFPILFFNCKFVTNNKKKFLKNFSVKLKEKNQKFEINFEGNINILNKKINFLKIGMDDSYLASKDDLKYFKNVFENTLLDGSFLNILNLKKIKEFVLEIS